MKKIGKRDMLKAQVNRCRPRLASSTVKSLFLASFIFLFFIFNSVFILAQPFQEFGEINIEYSKLETYPINQDIHFHFHTTNSTQFLSNESIDCVFSLVNSSGFPIIQEQDLSFHEGSDNEWGITVLKGNFTETDKFSYAMECNSSIQTGMISVGFEVTPTGDSTEEVDSIFKKESSIVLFGTLLAIILFIVYLYNREEYYLPMISGIIFLFVGVYSFSVLGAVLSKQISDVIGVLIIGLGLLSLSEAIWRFFPND